GGLLMKNLAIVVIPQCPCTQFFSQPIFVCLLIGCWDADCLGRIKEWLKSVLNARQTNRKLFVNFTIDSGHKRLKLRGFSSTTPLLGTVESQTLSTMIHTSMRNLNQ
ncbi:MAG: hypothetical protein AAFO77_09445, partial [Pseudomonadota bacterium]